MTAAETIAIDVRGGRKPRLSSAALPTNRRRSLCEHARQANIVNHIVKLTKISDKDFPDLGRGWASDGCVRNALDEPLRVEQFPILPAAGEKLAEYRCSVAVRLYLRFLSEGTAVFFLMFVLSAGAINDSVKRSETRHLCRTAASDEVGYRVLTRGASGDGVSASDVNSTLVLLRYGFEPHACGWTNQPVRRIASPDELKRMQWEGPWYYFLPTSIGGCQEYSNAHPNATSTRLLPDGPPYSPPLVIETPDAAYCLRGHPWSYLSQWMRLLSLAAFLLWLARLRYLSQSMAQQV